MVRRTGLVCLALFAVFVYMMRMFIEKFVSFTCEQLKLDSKLQWFCSLFPDRSDTSLLSTAGFFIERPGQGWEECQPTDFFKFSGSLFFFKYPCRMSDRYFM